MIQILLLFFFLSIFFLSTLIHALDGGDSPIDGCCHSFDLVTMVASEVTVVAEDMLDVGVAAPSGGLSPHFGLVILVMVAVMVVVPW